ncbi:MAG: tRNA lysidine(34) synthetase TilS, partial [Acidimicrobiia bacterium]|nr:tRNA lysidine(34) synthetase TilS [Acidimicrobiia bacterium]
MGTGRRAPETATAPTDRHALAAALSARCTFATDRRPLRCAVSGGADSLALLVLATAAAAEVTAVHVDHGLRPDSAGDAAVVRAAAERLGAAVEVVRVAVADGPNLEARARQARLAALGADIALGHTADDRAEGVLLALLRGAGPHGVGALRAGPRHPLLALRRVETEALCAAWGLDPVQDPTNADPRFTRNRIRHEVLPLLAEVAGRDPVPLLVRHAELSAALDDHVEAAAAAMVPDPTDARAVGAVGARAQGVGGGARRPGRRRGCGRAYTPAPARG